MLNETNVRDAYDEAHGAAAELLRRIGSGQRSIAKDRDVEWAARAALVVLERFDLDDDEIYERIGSKPCSGG